jgi:2-polyprenyl-3-methyl-5-hydroxy-6-metoxy-1,4-benzoquinol methylase
VKADARLAREITHHARIAARAEKIWNWDSPAGRCRADRRAQMFVTHGELLPGRCALELGCGTGVFTERVARSGATIHGIDASGELLATARRRACAGGRVYFNRGDVTRMPFAGEMFDVVYGSSILHHVDLEAALRETQRVLKPGGRAVFAEPNLFNPQIAFAYFVGPRGFFGLSPDEMAFSRFRARSVFRRVGFRDVHVDPVDFLHPQLPEPLIAIVSRLGPILERTPVVREIAGSLLIRARKR